MENLGSKLTELNQDYATVNTDIDLSGLAPPSQEIMSIEPSQITKSFIVNRKFKLPELQYMRNKFEIQINYLLPLGVDLLLITGISIKFIPSWIKKLAKYSRHRFGKLGQIIIGSVMSLNLFLAFGASIYYSLNYNDICNKHRACKIIDEVKIIFLSVYFIWIL